MYDFDVTEICDNVGPVAISLSMKFDMLACVCCAHAFVRSERLHTPNWHVFMQVRASWNVINNCNSEFILYIYVISYHIYVW